jgi:hypothetical protein
MKDQKKSCLWPTFYQGFISGDVGSCIVFDALRKDTICQLLPTGYRLARQTIAPSGQHPIYWCFNLNQRKVGTPIPMLCLNYHEFALVIPHVICTAEPGQVGAYAPVLFLNSLLGVLGGKIIWQLEKKWKKCRLTQQAFTGEDIGMTVSPLTHDEEILMAAFRKVGDPIAYQDCPNFLRIKSMLDQPLLSEGWRGYKSSRFILDYDELQIQPISSNVQTKNFVNGLQNMERKLPSIDKSVLGGFYFNLGWQLDWPKR